MATWSRVPGIGAHARSSTNAGIATPGATSSNAAAHTIAEEEWSVDAVEQAPDQAQVGLLVDLDVDEHERHVSVEAGEERLVHDCPRADRPTSGDRCEREPRIGAVAMRAGRFDWEHERRRTSEHRAAVGWCAAAAAQNGADLSSGSGTGRDAAVTGSRLRTAARRSRPTSTRARAGPARSARRVPARAAAPAGVRRSAPARWAVGTTARRRP